MTADELLSLVKQGDQPRPGKLFCFDRRAFPNTSVDDIDDAKVTTYIEKTLKNADFYLSLPKEQLYQNLTATERGYLTLGGLLFFAKNPQKYRPTYCIKAISFFGNSRGGVDYRDSRDIVGTIPEMFEEAMRFFKGNLHHVQAGQNFNSVGILEISETALEELLINALLHRDYTKNTSIKLMIFDDRVEIESPGCLPNSLTVEKIKVGNAVVRNNLLVSYGAKLLPYRGFGTGIIRSVESQPNIEFVNDSEGELFIARIPREK
jgi:predicted HTH transcriptional regulator